MNFFGNTWAIKHSAVEGLYPKKRQCSGSQVHGFTESCGDESPGASFNYWDSKEVEVVSSLQGCLGFLDTHCNFILTHLRGLPVTRIPPSGAFLQFNSLFCNWTRSHAITLTPFPLVTKATKFVSEMMLLPITSSWASLPLTHMIAFLLIGLFAPRFYAVQSILRMALLDKDLSMSLCKSQTLEVSHWLG